MRRIYTLLLLLLLFTIAKSQTPIDMSAQSNFTYTETFADIANWTFNAQLSDGTFTSGIGAAAWKGIAATTTTPGIPNATRITTLSNFFQTPGGGSPPTYSGGVYKGTQNLILLSTGTSDNTSSVGMDMLLDFTNLNAGTLSFDWASLNNSTGNRNASLRVYASIDGISFTEITAAQVLNFTNNAATAGSIVNVALPASFNNSATARLRFYFYNGTGGTTGSRPRVSIDNVKVTAVPTTPCTAPTAQATNFSLGTVINNAISFSFTPASPAPENYLIVMSTNNGLTDNPINGTIYSIGDNVGDGTVISLSNSTSITATGLNNSTNYYFFIFSMNNACTGGPLYLATNPLMGNATTLAGALPCATPSAQATALTFGKITTNSIAGSFTPAANTDEYLVVRTTSSSFTGTPTNGTVYNEGYTIGDGTVVSRSAATSFNTTGLSSGTTYHFFVYAINSANCSNGPVYNTASPLTANVSTEDLAACTTPTAQPTNLNLLTSNTTINGSFSTTPNTDNYLVVQSSQPALTATPANGTSYAIGASLGGGTVIGNTNANSFINYNLTAGTTYYYYVFGYNTLCNGGPLYLTANPLTGSATTTTVAALNYYFGNLHSHSSYSDGNADNATATPATDYAYAQNSMCMDFLGISEHNHSEAGMHLASWQPGIAQANAATTPTFLALHGMEWGVISNGGHVLVYGVDSLIGWESGNYNLYVAKSDYLGTPETTSSTGLFRLINNLNNSGDEAFASLAHPQSSDYNNIASVPFNATADSAVLGCAVESGPAFSTSTTYNDNPSSMGFLDYYTRLLSKGYHIAPFMDQDTHNTNFGRANDNRLCILSPTLTKPDFFAALKSRHFYATEDCDTRVSFMVNNQQMGSIVSSSNVPGISIYALDPTNASATPSIKLMYGVPGSNILPVQIASANAYTLSYADYTLANGETGYYYADITIAGNRTISAPVWYTKMPNTVVPVSLLSFTASLNNNRTVNLNWKTTNEVNNKLFIVERSLDGVNFTTVGTVNALSNTVNNYMLVDNNPANGINYYRLKEVDKDGAFVYSKTITIDLSKEVINAFTVQPNPVISNSIVLDINSGSIGKINVVINDVSGRVLLHSFIDVTKGNQSATINAPSLKAGVYYISLIWENEKITQKIVKL